MSTPLVSPTGSTSTYQVYGTPHAAAKELDMNSFLSLLTTELANQDPTNPVSDSEYFAQIAQMGTVQGMNDLKASQLATQASNLLGKTISAPRDPNSLNGAQSSTPVQGVVKYVTNKSGVPYLGVQEANGGYAEVAVNTVGTVTSS